MKAVIQTIGMCKTGSDWAFSCRFGDKLGSHGSQNDIRCIAHCLWQEKRHISISYWASSRNTGRLQSEDAICVADGRPCRDLAGCYGQDLCEAKNLMRQTCK